MHGGYTEQRTLIRGQHQVVFNRQGGILGRPHTGGHPGPDAEGVEVDHLAWRRDWRGEIEIRDLGTDEGTWIDGVRISLDWVRVKRGSMIRLGQSDPWVMTDGRRAQVAEPDDLLIASFYGGTDPVMIINVDGTPVYRIHGRRAQLLNLLHEHSEKHIGGWLAYETVAEKLFGTRDTSDIAALVNETRMRVAAVGLPHLINQRDDHGVLRFDAPERLVVAPAGFTIHAMA